MGLKNYTTKISARQSISEIQEMLQKIGAIGVIMEFEKDTGRVSQMKFGLEMEGKPIAFRLPLKWRESGLAISEDDSVPRAYQNRAKNDEDYCYRVAWRNLRDWVEAQATVVRLNMVKPVEVFLPYAVQPNDKTIFESLADDPSRLLGSGK